MSEGIYNGSVSEDMETFTDLNGLPGIIAALGELKSGSIITEEGWPVCLIAT